MGSAKRNATGTARSWSNSGAIVGPIMLLHNVLVFGLNASVFTADAGRACAVARQIRSGTVGHNGFRSDFFIAFGGFKQSGIGREGGKEGLHPFLEVKTIILDAEPDEGA